MRLAQQVYYTASYFKQQLYFNALKILLFLEHQL